MAGKDDWFEYKNTIMFYARPDNTIMYFKIRLRRWAGDCGAMLIAGRLCWKVSLRSCCQDLAYGGLDGVDLLEICHFLAIKITDVEYVKHLVYLGGNLGHPNIQVAPEQGISDSVKKPGEVIGVDFYDGEKVRAAVVHNNLVWS